SAPAEAPASSAPSAKPDAAPSSSAPAEKKEEAASDKKSSDAPLPPVTIYPPQAKPQRPVIQSRESTPTPVPVTQPRATVKRTTHATRTGTVRSTTRGTPWAATPVENAIAAAWPASQSQGGTTGQSGVYQNSTSSATKINTPIVNIPQSLSVVTKEFIADNAFQNLTDVTRYVPGVDVHQGEGNRDELIIRGVDSSANFFVNGFRDDVQIF